MKTIDAMKQAVCLLENLYQLDEDSRVALSDLREAIATEEAQTVEPVGEVVLRVIPAGHDTPEEDTYDIKWRNGFSPFDYKGPLFTHPAPATEPVKPTGERDELITTLRMMLAAYTSGNHPDLCGRLRQAIDMLAADAPKPTDMDRYTQATLAGHANGLAEGLAMASDAQQAALPKGWKLVPVEPTSGMWAQIPGNITCGEWVAQYKAMLAAAPQPPQADEPCYCDKQGIGKPGVTCGDCPRDYLPKDDAKDEKCKHANTNTNWDFVRCKDCGAVKHDRAGNGWHKSIEHAKQYARGKS